MLALGLMLQILIPNKENFQADMAVSWIELVLSGWRNEARECSVLLQMKRHILKARACASTLRPRNPSESNPALLVRKETLPRQEPIVIVYSGCQLELALTGHNLIDCIDSVKISSSFERPFISHYLQFCICQKMKNCHCQVRFLTVIQIEYSWKSASILVLFLRVCK